MDNLDGKSELERLITEAKDPKLRVVLKRKLGSLLDTSEAQDWKSSADRHAWIKFSSRPGSDPAELANYLAELACSDGGGGYIIEGVARRV